MENINHTLKKLASSENFQKRYEKMRKEILNHSDIRDFIRKHRDLITDEMLERSWGKLYEYINQSKECSRCESLDQCINIMNGYHPELIITRNSIDIRYERCPRKVMADEKRKNEKMIKSLYVPKDILAASFEDFEHDETRIDAVQKAVSFLMNYEQGKTVKGLYFYGKFGVGKSYLLGAIANRLAKKQISSMIVYVPELFR